MATTSNYEYIPLVPVGLGASTRQSPPNLPTRTILPRQRNRRIVQVASYPFLLLILYFFFAFYPKDQHIHVDPTMYLSHAGKAALATTIVLPRLQYEFEKNEGRYDERREKVKGFIKQTWDLYVQQAWDWHEVRPVGGGGRDSRYIFALTRADGVGMDGVQQSWMA